MSISMHQSIQLKIQNHRQLGTNDKYDKINFKDFDCDDKTYKTHSQLILKYEILL